MDNINMNYIFWPSASCSWCRNTICSMANWKFFILWSIFKKNWIFIDAFLIFGHFGVEHGLKILYRPYLNYQLYSKWFMSPWTIFQGWSNRTTTPRSRYLDLGPQGLVELMVIYQFSHEVYHTNSTKSYPYADKAETHITWYEHVKGFVKHMQIGNPTLCALSTNMRTTIIQHICRLQWENAPGRRAQCSLVPRPPEYG